MLPFLILMVSLLVFRALGFAGIGAFTSWHACARDAMAIMLLFTAAAHFTSMKDDLVRMIVSFRQSCVKGL